MEKGFTLVELLAVIVILGVLLIIAGPTVKIITNNSKKNALKSDAITYINAAKKNVVLEEEKDISMYNIEDLVDVKLNKNHYGLVFVERNKEIKYSIYLFDTGTGYYVGKKYNVRSIATVSESELKSSNYKVGYDETLRETSKNGNVDALSLAGGNFDFNVTINGNTKSVLYTPGDDGNTKICGIYDTIDRGTPVYIKKSDNTCKQFTTLNDNGYNMLVFETMINESGALAFSRKKSKTDVLNYLKTQTEYTCSDCNEFLVRILTGRDLATYFNIIYNDITDLRELTKVEQNKFYTFINGKTSNSKTPMWFSEEVMTKATTEYKLYYIKAGGNREYDSADTLTTQSYPLSFVIEIDRNRIYKDSTCSNSFEDFNSKCNGSVNNIIEE